MNRAARDCDRSDRRRAARRDVQFYHVGVPQRFHSEETLSEGAEILSGTPNAPTAARFRLRLLHLLYLQAAKYSPVCRVSPTTHRDPRDDNLIRNEAETQLLRQIDHVSTMRVFLVDERYITIRAPLNFACSMQAVLGFA